LLFCEHRLKQVLFHGFSPVAGGHGRPLALLYSRSDLGSWAVGSGLHCMQGAPPPLLLLFSSRHRPGPVGPRESQSSIKAPLPPSRSWHRPSSPTHHSRTPLYSTPTRRHGTQRNDSATDINIWSAAGSLFSLTPPGGLVPFPMLRA
jgi:hypothetical protein